jgi:hypothetical protein
MDGRTFLALFRLPGWVQLDLKHDLLSVLIHVRGIRDLMFQEDSDLRTMHVSTLIFPGLIAPKPSID